MRQIVLILLLIIIASHLPGLSPVEVKAQPEVYIWGEGRGNNPMQAEDAALKELVKQIFVSVHWTHVDSTSQVNGNVGEYSESVLKAWVPTLDLMGAQFIEMDRGRRAFCYIERSKIDRLWQDRREKIEEYVSVGQVAERKNEIDAALKNYYWALVLLRIHPHEDRITYSWGGEERLLKPILTNRIDNLLKGLCGQVTFLESHDGITEIEMRLFYREKPISSLTFSYNAGPSTQRHTARNGTAMLHITDDCLKIMPCVTLNVEYMFPSEAKHDNELLSALDDPNIPWFPNNTFDVSLHKRSREKAAARKPSIKTHTATGEVKILKPSEAETWSKKIEQVIAAIESHDTGHARDCFTDKGYSDFETIAGYGNCKLAHTQAPVQYIDVDGRVTARSVECLFDFRRNISSFTDKLNFQFDETGRIDEVTFALGDQALDDLFNDTKLGDCQLDKIRIAQFLETYKTAYCLKDIDFVKQVFADNALIIVGRVLKDTDRDLSDNWKNSSLGSDKVQLVQKSKSEYVRDLAYCFNSNEYINIRFDNSEVVKAPVDSGRVYGIQLAQNYSSSSYADRGYLFLMFDLTDKDKPQIHIRAWQPRKFEDGTIIGVEKFDFDAGS